MQGDSLRSIVVPPDTAPVTALNLRRKEGGIAAGLAGDEMQTSFRSEEHTSELQSLMRISYAVFCLKKKSKRKESSINNTNVKRILSICIIHHNHNKKIKTQHMHWKTDT